MVFRLGLWGVLLFSISDGALAAPGQLDPTFGGSGKVTTSIVPLSNSLSAMTEQSDGKVIAVGSCLVQFAGFFTGDFCLARYETNGSLDALFGNNGTVVTAISFVANDAEPYTALQPDGKIVLAGTCGAGFNGRNTFCVARYLPNGAFDATFNNGGTTFTNISTSADCFAKSVALTSNGRIVVGGYCQVGEAASFVIVRYLSNGKLDTTFGAQGILAAPMIAGQVNRITGLAPQGDNKLIAAGSCGDAPGNSMICLTRLEPDGSPDLSFASGGTATLVVGTGVDNARSVTLQSDGRIVIGGDCRVGDNVEFCAARLMPDGAPDLTFSGTGSVVVAVVPGTIHRAIRLTLQADGKLLVGGNCGYGPGSKICLLRLNGDGTVDSTFGVDGRATSTFLLDTRLIGATSLILKVNGKAVVGGSCGGDFTYSFCLAQFKGGPYNPLACTLNIDADDTVQPATDAFLILRYLLGYRGNALTDGVLGTNPTRTGQALETYLASLNLDADGDGQVHAMTDGLLILRAMLGLSGNALTAGAVNTSSSTVRNAQQILTWIESTHGVACLP